MGRKRTNGLPSQVKTVLASLTCFGKLSLHRALSCWLQVPDHITLWPQSHFIAVTSIGQVVSSLTEDLHFTAVLNVCEEVEDQ